MLETRVIFDNMHKDGFYSPENFLPFLEELEKQDVAKSVLKIAKESTYFDVYSIRGVSLFYSYRKTLFNDEFYPGCTLTLTGEPEAIAKAEELIKPK